MKLRNKKTGEIGLVHCDATMFSNKIGVFIDNNHIDLRNPYKIYTSLAELNAEWEDAPEEPKEYWYIDTMVCGVYCTKIKKDEDLYNFNKEIGNYFETKEEAESAVRKLKAWKRLKDGGFVFCGKGDCLDTIKYDYGPAGYNRQDFELLFGGEE